MSDSQVKREIDALRLKSWEAWDKPEKTETLQSVLDRVALVPRFEGKDKSVGLAAVYDVLGRSMPPEYEGTERGYTGKTFDLFIRAAHDLLDVHNRSGKSPNSYYTVLRGAQLLDRRQGIYETKGTKNLLPNDPVGHEGRLAQMETARRALAGEVLEMITDPARREKNDSPSLERLKANPFAHIEPMSGYFAVWLYRMSHRDTPETQERIESVLIPHCRNNIFVGHHDIGFSLQVMGRTKPGSPRYERALDGLQLAMEARRDRDVKHLAGDVDLGAEDEFGKKVAGVVKEKYDRFGPLYRLARIVGFNPYEQVIVPAAQKLAQENWRAKQSPAGPAATLE